MYMVCIGNLIYIYIYILHYKRGRRSGVATPLGGTNNSNSNNTSTSTSNSNINSKEA